MTGTEDSVEWVDARGERRVSNDPQALMRSQLGWSLPLAALPFWLQGRVQPGQAVRGEQRSAAGDLMTVQQSGWTLRFDGYEEHPQQGGVARRPGLILADSEALNVRISVRDWR